MPTTDARRPRRASKGLESTGGPGLEVELERHHDASSARPQPQDAAVGAAPLASVAGTSADAVAAKDERRRIGAENLLELLGEKERELQAIGNELDRFQARLRVHEAAGSTSDDSAVRMDVYRELLARTEAVHLRFEHLRILVENLDKKIEAGFGEMLAYFREERELGKVAAAQGFGALLRRSLPAVLLVLASAALVLLANMVS